MTVFRRSIETLIGLVVAGSAAFLIYKYLPNMFVGWNDDAAAQAIQKNQKIQEIQQIQQIFALLTTTGALGGLILVLYNAALAPNANPGDVSILRRMEWVRIEADGIYLGFVGNMVAGAALANATYFLVGTALKIEADKSTRSFFGLIFIGLAAGLSTDLLFRSFRQQMDKLVTRTQLLESNQQLLAASTDINRYYADARASLKAGELDEAEQLFQKALSIDGRHTDSQMGLAEVREARAQKLLAQKAGKPAGEVAKIEAQTDALLSEAVKIMEDVVAATPRDPYLGGKAQALKEKLAGRLEYAAELEALRPKGDPAKVQALLDKAVAADRGIEVTIAKRAEAGQPYAKFAGQAWFAALAKKFRSKE